MVVTISLAEALHAAEARLRAAEIEDARLEAALLLGHALGLSREALFARLREPLAAEAGATYETLIARRLAHEPSAYITGHKEFYGLDFACSPDALIPRPETELLVELALERLRGHEGEEAAPLVVDVGTGCGAIAVSLAVHGPAARIIAVDTSRPALVLAHRNAEAHGVGSRIAFVRGSLLDVLREPCDLIVANLPYIPSAVYTTLVPEIREHEPRSALDAGSDGTGLIGSLLAQARRCLGPHGLLLAEHGWDQAEKLRAAARMRFPHGSIDTRRDLAGHERVLVVEH